MSNVSVIIPIYNVEKYLKKCLESVANQTLQDIEIICVNDGSTDGSFDILKNFSQKDPRFVIINKQNEGVSVARNVGLKKVTSPYLMFLDADDYLTPNACEALYNKIKTTKSDIVNFKGYEISDECIKETYYNPSLEKFEKSNDLNDLLPVLTYCWNKIYKTTFLKNSKVAFPKGIKTAEDGVFSLLLHFKKPKYSNFLDVPLIYYRRNNINSATTNTKNCIETDIEAFKYLIEQTSFAEQNLEVQLAIVDKFLDGAVYYWNTYPQNRKFYLKDLKKYNEIISEKFNKNKVLPLFINEYKKKVLQQIFSIKNDSTKTHKIITILGLKIKFKKK